MPLRRNGGASLAFTDLDDTDVCHSFKRIAWAAMTVGKPTTGAANTETTAADGANRGAADGETTAADGANRGGPK